MNYDEGHSECINKLELIRKSDDKKANFRGKISNISLLENLKMFWRMF
jgi:hypothetical protein